MKPNTAVVVAWHNYEQRDVFKKCWNVEDLPPWLFLQQDKNKEGCGVTKNKGIQRALEWGADIVVVLDDDCLPVPFPEQQCPFVYDSLVKFCEAHEESLLDIEFPLYASVTQPHSRGTPFLNRTVKMPVAASMGFWKNVGDYDAPRQLVHGVFTTMKFNRDPIFGNYFSLSGMNMAFRPKEWGPWAQFIDVPRFDDIWFGWLLQKEAYRRGYCFSMSGPDVVHSRQSNVWNNLRQESVNLERNETLWSDIAQHPSNDYEVLRKLLPV